MSWLVQSTNHKNILFFGIRKQNGVKSEKRRSQTIPHISYLLYAMHKYSFLRKCNNQVNFIVNMQYRINAKKNWTAGGMKL